jgi:hypothetical protein
MHHSKITPSSTNAMSAATLPEILLHQEDLDMSQNLDDDNIALLKKKSSSGGRRSPRILPIDRKSAHSIKSSSVGSVGALTKGGSSTWRHAPNTANATISTSSNQKTKTNRGISTSPPNSYNNLIIAPKGLVPATSDNASENNPLRRSVTVDSISSSARISSNRRNASENNPLRRIATVDSISSSARSSSNRRILKRRTSMGHATTETKSAQLARQCPATVSTIPKPSLLERLQQDELFRDRRGIPCPLPSIMGDSIEDSKDDSREDSASSSLQPTQTALSNNKLNPHSDDEELDDETDLDGCDQHHTNNNQHSFYQFDPSKADHLLLSLVCDNSADSISIFPMQETRQKGSTDDKDRSIAAEEINESGDEEEKDDISKQLPVENPVIAAATSALCIATDDDTTPDDLPPLAEQLDESTPRLSTSFGDASWSAEFTLKADNDDTTPDAPPLAEQLLDDSTPRLRAIFGNPWSAEEFTLKSDNARGHVELDDGIKEVGARLEGDDNKDDENMHASMKKMNDQTNEENEHEGSDDDGSSVDESASLSQSEEQVSEDDETEEIHEAQTSQALLQFNHTRPDALDYAPCVSHDASIFRMDNANTLQVPVMKTTEISPRDKQLNHVKNSSNKDKRPSMLSEALAKAKSLTRSKAAIVISQPLRLPTRSASAHIPRGKLLETSKRTDITKQGSDHGLLRRVQSGTQIEKADRKPGSSARNSADKTSKSNHPSTDKKTGNEKDRSRKERSDDKDNDANGDKVTDNGEIEIDRHTSRRRRDRGETVKGRRESTRGKSRDDNDKERKERLRKRASLRKAVSARVMPGRAKSEKSPKKRPGHIGHGRRRIAIASDVNNNIAKVELDPLDCNRHVKDPTVHESTDIVTQIHRRSTIRKSQSLRAIATRPITSSVVKKATLRRAATDQGATAINASSRRSSSNRRSSEARTRARSKGGKDREGGKDLDQSEGKEGAEQSCKEKRQTDRRQPRKCRRSVESEGKEDDMDKSMDKSMNRSGESTDGARVRHRGGEKRKPRRTKSSRDKESGGEGMDKSTASVDESKHSMGGSNNGSNRESSHHGRRASKVVSSRGKDRDENTGAANTSTTTRLNASMKQKNDSSSLNSLIEDAGGEDHSLAQNGRSSSLRLERTFDASFPDLRCANESLNGTFHNDLGDAGPIDRRNGFTKSLSLKTFGKGARNIFIGGTRAEKKSLLDVDDESVLS